MLLSGVVLIRGSMRHSATTADWSSVESHEPLNTTSCCESPGDFICSCIIAIQFFYTQRTVSTKSYNCMSYVAKLYLIYVFTCA